MGSLALRLNATPSPTVQLMSRCRSEKLRVVVDWARSALRDCRSVEWLLVKASALLRSARAWPLPASCLSTSATSTARAIACSWLRTAERRSGSACSRRWTGPLNS